MDWFARLFSEKLNLLTKLKFALAGLLACYDNEGLQPNCVFRVTSGCPRWRPC